MALLSSYKPLKSAELQAPRRINKEERRTRRETSSSTSARVRLPVYDFLLVFCNDLGGWYRCQVVSSVVVLGARSSSQRASRPLLGCYALGLGRGSLVLGLRLTKMVFLTSLAAAVKSAEPRNHSKKDVDGRLQR